jgi:Tfp pilus assembly protein PilN
MKAVNLLPSDMRKAAAKATARVRPERAEGIGAYVVLGALALCVTALAAYVLTNNSVKQRTADLEQVGAEAEAVAAHAAALKPYADYEAMATARVDTVRGLAAARFDWEQALRDLSRAVPSNVELQNLNGDMGLPGTEGSGGDPLRGSIQAPAITMTGCAPDQPAVAAMMARLRAVDGVTRVSLSKSVKGENAGPVPAGSGDSGPCGTKSPPSFSAVVFFEGSSALQHLSEESGGVPVPTAVAGGGEQGASGAVEQANGTAGTAEPTSTTPGSTP